MLQEVIEKLSWSLTSLGYKPAIRSLEAWGLLVHTAMSGEQRHFHTIDHLRALWDGAEPLATLAILFHDVVYVQVDQGLPPGTQSSLSQYIRRDGASYRLRAIDSQREQAGALVLRLFGVGPGQSPAIQDGLNELLSALIAVHCLRDVLSMREVAQVAACIEGTIPFRLADPEGRGCFDVLGERLAEASAALGIDFSGEQIDETIELAVDVANRDVANFAEADPGRFLSYTWQLLPESHPPLRSPGRYTVREYREALEKTEEFLSGLVPEAVFHHYRRPGRSDEVVEKRKRAARNLTVAAEYLHAKLVAVGLLEAIAELTGGDAAVALFMGDSAQVGGNGPRLEHFLPQVEPGVQAADCDERVLRLLEVGRAEESSFDLRASPLTALVYRRVGKGGIARGLELVRGMFRGEREPTALLEAMDRWTVATIAGAAVHLALTRSDELRALEQRFSGSAG